MNLTVLKDYFQRILSPKKQNTILTEKKSIHLSTEIWFKIFDYCNPHELIQFAATGRSNYKLLTSYKFSQLQKLSTSLDYKFDDQALRNLFNLSWHSFYNRFLNWNGLQNTVPENSIKAFIKSQFLDAGTSIRIRLKLYEELPSGVLLEKESEILRLISLLDHHELLIDWAGNMLLKHRNTSEPIAVFAHLSAKNAIEYKLAQAALHRALKSPTINTDFDSSIFVLNELSNMSNLKFDNLKQFVDGHPNKENLIKWLETHLSNDPVVAKYLDQVVPEDYPVDFFLKSLKSLNPTYEQLVPLISLHQNELYKIEKVLIAKLDGKETGTHARFCIDALEKTKFSFFQLNSLLKIRSITLSASDQNRLELAGNAFSKF